jgi:hypothetical protein
MRRTAAGLLSAAAILACGCGTMRHYPRRDVPVTRAAPAPSTADDSLLRTGLDESAESEGSHFARENVPDSVMLPGQYQGGYQDGPGAPY